MIELLRSRRTVSQGRLQDGAELDHLVVVEAIESARWAPNHKRTEPWRFHLLDPSRIARLAGLWAEQLERQGSKPDKVETKRREWGQVPGVVVVTCHSAEDATEVTRLEDYGAVCCAVQNLSLHLWAEGIASKWSTAGVWEHEGFWPLLGYAEAPEGARLVALLFYGLPTELPVGRRNKALSEVLVDFRQEGP